MRRANDEDQLNNDNDPDFTQSDCPTLTCNLGDTYTQVRQAVVQPAELKAVRGTISKKITEDCTEPKHNSQTSYRYNEPLDAVNEIVFGTKKDSKTAGPVERAEKR